MSTEHKGKQQKTKSADTEQFRDQGQFNDDKNKITSRVDVDTDHYLEAKWESVRKPLQVNKKILIEGFRSNALDI
ncbi:hypothetical protein KUV50_13060 [Membranicola marinus]|uniref:Uncharacterized protein n=1 Tax=Membranihabitans marinus TaxID=1227546 RepID=A0A953HPX8_9BACT|nr:hypothetical protein [Membranihabitans marinus]MBY5959074.1 hypothetical protein [Membranihabitans marinus]